MPDLLIRVLHLACIAIVANSSSFIEIGANFRTYETYDYTRRIRRIENGCERLAALVLAVDEINRRSDILKDVKLNVITGLPHDDTFAHQLCRNYPENPYFEASAAAYYLHAAAPSMLVVIDAVDAVQRSSSFARTMNSWGVATLIAKSYSTQFAHNDIYPLTMQITPSSALEATLLVKLLLRFNWKKVGAWISTDSTGMCCCRYVFYIQ
jgi:hypothetical protein